MAKETVHVGDVGTIFEITVTEGGTALSVASATAKSILFQKPTGSVLTKSASFTSDGSDGKIRYVAASADIDVEGSWRVQAKITFDDEVYSTLKGEFTVGSTLA